MMFPHRAAEAAAVVHDPVAIEKLKEIDPDGTLVHKWIRGFLRQAPGRVHGIRSATDDEVFPAVVAAAHSLKNVVGWLGGERLWLVCHDLEQAARSESQAECRSHLSALQEQLPLLAACLVVYLEGNVTQRM